MYVYLLPREWKPFAYVSTARTKFGTVLRYDLPVLLDSNNADSCYRGMNGSSDSHILKRDERGSHSLLPPHRATCSLVSPLLMKSVDAFLSSLSDSVSVLHIETVGI